MSIVWISFELWNIILPISPISCFTCTLLKQCMYWNPNLKSASKLKSEWYLWYHTYTLTTFSHVQHFTCIILNRGWCDTQSSNMELEPNMTLMMTLFTVLKSDTGSMITLGQQHHSWSFQQYFGMLHWATLCSVWQQPTSQEHNWLLSTFHQSMKLWWLRGHSSLFQQENKQKLLTHIYFNNMAALIFVSGHCYFFFRETFLF